MGKVCFCPLPQKKLEKGKAPRSFSYGSEILEEKMCEGLRVEIKCVMYHVSLYSTFIGFLLEKSICRSWD